MLRTMSCCVIALCQLCALYLLQLKKKYAGSEWTDLDDVKDKKEAARKQRVEHGALKDADTQVSQLLPLITQLI